MIHHTEVTTEVNGIKTCLTCREEAFRIQHDWYCNCEGMGSRMDFETWLNFGIINGYCSEQFCNTHDGYPMHESEELEWDEGNDPCAHMVRLGSETDWAV